MNFQIKKISKPIFQLKYRIKVILSTRMVLALQISIYVNLFASAGIMAEYKLMFVTNFGTTNYV